MADRWRPQVRGVVLEMFETQKWCLLIRDHEMDDWRPFGNKISGKAYVYQNLDKAIYAQKEVQRGRFLRGNTKLVKAEKLEAFMLDQSGQGDSSSHVQD